MTGDPSGWYRIYGVAALLLLLALGVIGWIDPDALAGLIREGGIIEVGTALLWLAMGGLAVWVAEHRRRRRLPWVRWLWLAAAGIFLAGEEVEWGRELPWAEGTLLARSEAVHNVAAHALVELGRAWGPVAAVALVILVVTAAFLVARRFAPGLGARAARLHGATPLLVFLAVAVAWLALTSLLDLSWNLGLPYVPGVWPLEEAGEFLGALAGVFAVAAHAATAEPTRLRQ